ncbi:hypothetical protein Hanom_Chr15g01412271 [Helianthus anomalus]
MMIPLYMYDKVVRLRSKHVLGVVTVSGKCIVIMGVTRYLYKKNEILVLLYEI